MTSHDYARAMQAAAELLLSKPEFLLPNYQKKFTDSLNYFSDKDGFMAAARVLGGKKSIEEWSGTADLMLTTETEQYVLMLRVNRDKVCRVVEPAKPAVYDCEPLLTPEEEKEVAS